MVLKTDVSVRDPSSSCEMVKFCDSGPDKFFSAHILISPIAIKFTGCQWPIRYQDGGSSRRRERGRLRQVCVFLTAQAVVHSIFLLYCFQLISYNMWPICHQQVIVNESERELEESKRWKRLYLAYRGIPIIRTFRKLNENLKNRLLQKSGVKLQCLTKGGRFVIYWSC